MISSGMKRGLAASAISAMAVTGLPLLASSASADSMADQAADTTLLSPATDNSQDVSIKNDGQNSTVSLVANAPAGATHVEFSYNNGADHVIGTATRDANGQFALEWTPPASIYNTDVTIKATALDGQDQVVGTVDDATGVNVSTSADTVELNANPAVGYYVPNDGSTTGTAIVSGTTSALTTAPTVKTVVGGSGAGQVKIAAASTGATSRSFKATVPVDSTKLSDTGTGAQNQFAVQADVATSAVHTGDAQAYNAYAQTISGLSANAKQSQVTTGGSTSVTVTVTDQNGKPVAGVTVLPTPASDTGAGTTSNDVTDADGQVVYTGVTKGTHRYFADDNLDGAYNGGSEYAQDVTVTEYSATPSTITFDSKDGNAFDVDEFANGDLTVTVKDQNGNPVANEIVNYSYDYVPFKPTATDKAKTINEAPATTDADGVATLVDPATDGATGGTYTLHAYVNRDTTPGQGAGDLAIDPVVLKIGESDVVWSDSSPAQRPAGTIQTFTGALELADGTGLGGRDLNVNYAHDTVGTHDAKMSAQSNQPAGTTRTGDSSATVVTKADGSYGVSLTDPAVTPASAQTDELNDTLTASGTAAGVGTDATENLEVDWLVNAAPASLNVVADSDTTTGENDPYEELIDNEATPGRPVTFSVKVTNKADGTGTPLANQQVTFKTDHGFFTTPAATEGDLVADPAAAEGANYGEWKNLSDTYVATTDANGIATVTLAIGRDAGFDDDGMVTSLVTAKVGNVVNDADIAVDWSSLDALNAGEVEVSLADAQTVHVLPKAPTSEDVNFDVFARDQFGNLTQDDVKVTDDLAAATLDEQATPAHEDASTVTVTSQFTKDQPQVIASSNAAGDMTLTASWTGASNTWTDGSTTTDGFQATRKTGTKTVTDKSETVNWYVIDYAASTFTLTHSGADTQPVGTTVTETYKAVDQNGEPLTGYDVTFFRTGPDNLQDGDGNSVGRTNNAGEAYYVFQGAKAGTATITAVLREGDADPAAPATGDLISQGEQTDTVKFDGAVAIKARLNGKDNAENPDKLKVNASAIAKGAVAKLYKIVNGERTLVGKAKLDSNGDHKFIVDDMNGKARTKYIAVVKRTAKSLGATTNKKSIR